MDEQRKIANVERAIRIIQQAKAMTCIKHIHDNIIINIEIETSENDIIEISKIKALIPTVLNEHKNSSALIQSKMLFLSIATLYNNHDVAIKISDINECGLKVYYNNMLPHGLIKV